MLSETKMVKARKVIESLYTGRCTASEYQEYTKLNKSTGHREVIVLEDQPCRLSFKTIASADQSGTGATLKQTVKLMLSPEVKITPGSKLSVTQNGVTVEYKCSGEPAVYSSHQEIILELWKGWA